MLSIQGSSRWRALVTAVVLSLVFSQVGFMVLLFTVPLYTLYSLKGSRQLLEAAGSVMLLLVVMAVWKTRSVNSAELRGALVIIEIMMPVLLLLGMFFVIDIIPVLSGFRRLYRLFIATAAAVLVFIPVYLVLQQNETFKEVLSDQINAVAGLALGGNLESYEGEVAKSYFGEGGLLGYMKTFYMRSAASMFFLVLLISARVSELIVSRLRRIRPMKLIEFRVPTSLLWPVLICGVGMLLEIFELFDLGYFSIAVWNIGIVLMFVYGLQGLAILRMLFLRFNLPASLRIMIESLLILMIIIPGVNYIVIIGLPVLGISETWINLRNSNRST